MEKSLLQYIITWTHIWEDSWITYTKFNTDRYNEFLKAYNIYIKYTEEEYSDISNYHRIVQALLDTQTMFSYSYSWWPNKVNADKAQRTINEIITLWNENPISTWDDDGVKYSLSYRDFIRQNY